MNVFLDSRFDEVYRRHPLVLVDVGARGGLKSNWSAAERHLRFVGFEPEQAEHGRLIDGTHASRSTFLEVALHNRREPLSLNVARDRGLTSIFQPNREFLDSFPEADRFDVVGAQQLEADTLDNQLLTHRIHDVDFVKADTQGSELFVLEGGARVLASSVIGVEVEVEFAPIYKDQPLFADVDRFLRGLGYHLFDLRPCYWKRAAGRSVGGPRGQIIWADALYLKSVSALRSTIHEIEPMLQQSKVLRALSIAVLYGYYDYAFEITREVGGVFSPDERAAIETGLRKDGERRGLSPQFPGRRPLAAVLRRLWKWCLERDDAWSVSGANLGNLS
jgi:FkbM family methyltransferase